MHLYFRFLLFGFLICFIQSPVYAYKEGSFWSTDLKYWVLENNENQIKPLRQEDIDILNDIDSNGLLYGTYVTNANYRTSPQTVGFWAYLAELGVAIINNGNSQDAELYLAQTEKTAKIYKEKLYKGLGKGKGKLVNTKWINDRKSWTLGVGDTLPFNMNASYAYFCAVRNNVHKKYRGTESFYDSSMAFHIYQYLHTQIETFKYNNKTYVKWKYDEHRADGTADDISHAGLSARALAYGADYNYVWRWWTNVLFIYQRPIILNSSPKYMDFTGHSPSITGASRYWNYPYGNNTNPLQYD